MATKPLNGSNETANMADLKDQIETLRNDIGTLTRTMADMGKGKGDDAMAHARATMSDMGEQVADHAETARLRAMELQGQANDFIRTQPATALGIAAGAGFLVGFFGARK